MRFRGISIVLLCSCALWGVALGQQAGPETDVNGSWLISADVFGTTVYLRMKLNQDSARLSGTYTGDKLTAGTVNGRTIHLLAASDNGTTSEVNATVKDGIITGSTVEIDPGQGSSIKYTFTATRVKTVKHGASRRHEFTPTVYYRQFSPRNKPVLTIAPGDIVHTTTVDAEGADEKGIKRVLGGNPQTGPFYIEGAEPGDTLVVHILKLRLNRDYAVSDDAIVERAMNSELALMMKDGGKTIRWHIDAVKGVAYPESAGPNLANYTVPLKPMLGCIATAVGPEQAPPSTGDSGGWGGNMDFTEIGEGATVYLPVANPGALLYLGDAHAQQGDGELNGSALETSMDVEFSVDVIPGARLAGRLVETPTHIITMGLSASLDDALKAATNGMARWLNKEYKLTPSETAQVLGTAAEYKISEVADRNSGVVLKIDKKRLTGLVKN